MDTATTLNDAALRIRDSLDHFARLKGWAREDYHLVMVANPVWLSLQVDLFAKEYDSRAPENAQYDEVYDRLEEDLKDDPGLYEATSVLLWPFSREFDKQPRLAENYIRLDDSLLNPGWVEPRPMSQVTARDEV